MATPLPINSHNHSNGSSITVSGAPSTTRGSWGRNGNPGSAFRGLSRGGRGGSGRGGGRGGRGGRGGGASRGGRGAGAFSVNQLATTPTKTDSSSPSNPVSKPLPPVSATEKASTPSAATANKSKTPSRRVSRSIPSLVVDPPSPALEQPPSVTSPHSSARRKRSQNSTKALASSGPRAGAPLSLDETPLRSQRVRNGPVPQSAPAKDTPPHLVTPFDMRTNIDALVERVRAVAMADNRPSTPGSHIDWAGDDDDSLPDLDDWGVSTTASNGDKEQAISPIIVDGLKSLPEPIVNSEAPPLAKVEVADSLPLSAPENNEQGRDDESQKHFTSSSTGTDSHTANSPTSVERWKSPHVAPPLRSVKSDTGDEIVNHNSVKSTSTSSSSSSASQASPSIPKSSNIILDSPKTPLHPSLPPKPVSAVESHNPLLKVRHGATPIRIRDLEKQFMSVEKLMSKPVEILAQPIERPQPVEQPEFLEQPKMAEPEVTETAVVEPAVEQAIMQTINTSSSTETTQDADPFADNQLRDGLEASIHASNSLSDSLSAPSTLSSFSSVPPSSRNFHHTHNRSHTVGRPPQFPFSPPTYFSRSGTSTPRGGHSHTRHHSSPPAGTTNHRTHHSTRPVITGDAISKLARTIGRATDTPARTATATSSNE